MYAQRQSALSLLATLVVVGAGLFAFSVHAAQSRFDLEVKAQVIGNCYLNLATDIDYGFLVPGVQATHDILIQ